MSGRYVVLVSGRGSNLEALLDARLPGVCAAVISNRPDALALDTARTRGVATGVVDHRGFATRELFDDALAVEIERHQPDLVILAGFMRLLGAVFVRRFEGRMINIHPSLLPAFPGLNTHAQALSVGVRIHGCTVHFVVPEMDAGPIIAQAAVPVVDGDTPESLAQRVLVQEHRLYPLAVSWFLEGRLRLEAGHVRFSGKQSEAAWLCSPSP
jgi:phosphoribosylglycinamide formyltransferase-1